jgi:MOSC domain-containing protein YiiM
LSAPAGRVASVNVGRERLVSWRGRAVPTGIYKEPVSGRVALRGDAVAGDTVSDPKVHGGWSKAVYAYPSEHYEFWRRELPGVALAPGAFGENLTTEGLREDGLVVGQRLRVGSALLQVTQPRLPCFKLGIKFERADMVKRFLESRRTGFYLAIVEPGDVGAGDAIETKGSPAHAITVADLVRLAAEDDDPDLRARIVAADALPRGWGQG